MSIVRYFSDNIIVMKDGNIIEEGETSEILKKPNEDYTKELLSSVI